MMMNGKQMSCTTFSTAEAKTILAAFRASGVYGDLKREEDFIKATGWAPEWFYMSPKNRWLVKHCERVYEVTAVSEANAINDVRFRLYGRVPMESLPPFVAFCPHAEIVKAIGREWDFQAVPPSPQKLTKLEAMARLRRLAS